MTALDVAPLVGDIPPTTITVRTFGAEVRDALGQTTATATETSIEAVVHPSGRRELERLGLDTRRETISVYTTTAVGTSDGVRPPEIDYGGRTYVVIRLGDYSALGGLYLIHAALRDGVA